MHCIFYRDMVDDSKHANYTGYWHDMMTVSSAGDDDKEKAVKINHMGKQINNSMWTCMETLCCVSIDHI